MVDPFRVVTAVKRIDHCAVVQVKIKGVIRVAGVMGVAAYRLSHADDLAHILDHRLACGDVAGREHTFAVHVRRLHMDQTGDRQVAQSGYFKGTR